MFSLGDLQLLGVGVSLAGAVTVRVKDGEPRVYFVYFVSDYMESRK
jgi:hypothetical protein